MKSNFLWKKTIEKSTFFSYFCRCLYGNFCSSFLPPVLLDGLMFVKPSLLCLQQVITSIGELVEVCSIQIQSGWRPLFSALETVHSSSKSELKEYLVGEYSMGTSFLCCLFDMSLFLRPIISRT